MSTEVRTVLLTGGIGSGKSAVRKILTERGIPCFDADSVVKSYYKDTGDGPCLLPEIERIAGGGIRKADGTFDKKAFAGIIFSEYGKLRQVERLVFPVLAQDFIEWRDKSASEGHKTVVLESATALDKPDFPVLWDCCVWVDAPAGLRIERVMERDKCSREAVADRMALQKDISAHRGRIDHILVNDGDFSKLTADTISIFHIEA